MCGSEEVYLPEQLLCYSFHGGFRQRRYKKISVKTSPICDQPTIINTSTVCGLQINIQNQGFNFFTTYVLLYFLPIHHAKLWQKNFNCVLKFVTSWKMKRNLKRKECSWQHWMSLWGQTVVTAVLMSMGDDGETHQYPTYLSHMSHILRKKCLSENERTHFRVG